MKVHYCIGLNRSFLFVLLNSFMFCISVKAQFTIKGVVKDSVTLKPIAYCNIGIKGTSHGTISNYDGAYSLKVSSSKDSIIFSCVGYKPAIISVKELKDDRIILLVPGVIDLESVNVEAQSDFLYQIITNCAEVINRQKQKTESKVYYSLISETRERHKTWKIPVEFIEMYYNSSFKGLSLEELKLKNGRAALAEYDNSNFINSGTSRIFKILHLTQSSDYLPEIPFQFNKSRMRKNFSFRLESSDNENYRVAFTPKISPRKNFAGEAWISKADWFPAKIKLTIKDATLHPFLPFWRTDSLSNVNLDFTYYFSKADQTVRLDHIEFKLCINYHGKIYQEHGLKRESPDKTVETSGIIFFYDYGNPFILPKFDYDNNLADYYKLQVIPYNEFFWNSTELMLSTAQISAIKEIAKNGHLTNFNNLKAGHVDLNNFYGSNSIAYNRHYIFWNDSSRIFYKNIANTGEVERFGTLNMPLLLNLKVDFMLDINTDGNGYNCKSYCVFDPFKSAFHFNPEVYTNTFLNLYFDICEIERRKMQVALDQPGLSLSQIDSIYYKACENMKVVTARFLDEVKLGRNEFKMKKWNEYVKTNLGIDNIRVFEELDMKTAR